MITKEKLRELIEQEETVWCVSELWGSNKLKLHNKDVRDSDCFHISKTLLLSDSIEFYDEEETYRVPFQLLFETEKEYLKHQEEAKWEEEFGCIERTVGLDLPKWEDIEKDKNFYYIRHFVLSRNFSFFIEIYKFTNTIRVSWSGGYNKSDPRFERKWKLTKENYFEACRKAKELFLGGE